LGQSIKTVNDKKTTKEQKMWNKLRF